ncbi:hypothetical protein ALC56_00170 [Trachymyrmex septentrionalis]|uniref:Uncharacterized protein n=1 Tax=Trachymyrmex septentrionalis TaxID=34720 RepID=A0A195FZT9_9HYME|nr:hypothetical protein ALC56_00170 [Trachymyrmex septentrionalis]
MHPADAEGETAASKDRGRLRRRRESSTKRKRSSRRCGGGAGGDENMERRRESRANFNANELLHWQIIRGSHLASRFFFEIVQSEEGTRRGRNPASHRHPSSQVLPNAPRRLLLPRDDPSHPFSLLPPPGPPQSPLGDPKTKPARAHRCSPTDRVTLTRPGILVCAPRALTIRELGRHWLRRSHDTL